MKPARPKPQNKKRSAALPRAVTLLLGIVLLALTTTGHGNTPLPPFVLSEGTDSATLTLYSEYLRDTDDNLTLDDILSGSVDHRFTPALRKTSYLGLSQHPWWLRLAISNNSNEEQQRILEISPGLFSEATFFRPVLTDNGRDYQIQHSGTDANPPWADLHHRKQLFELSIPAGATYTYYWRVLPNHAFVYNMQLNDTNQQLRQSLLIDGIYMILAGILLGLVLYNLGLWLLQRNKAHLLYSAFLFLMVLSVLTAAGFIGIQYLHAPGLHPRLEISSILLTLLANVAFSRAFLNSHIEARSIDRVIRAVMGLALIILLLQWTLPLGPTFLITYGLGLFSALLILALALFCWQRGVEHARLHLIARLPLILLTLAITPASFGLTSLPSEAPLLILTAGTLEALLFAIGLSLHSRQNLRRQQDRASEKAATEAAWQSRNETLARLSHEIRTPMSGILGMAEILQDTPLTPNQKECVGTIQQAGFGLLKLLNDVLEYSRIEHGETDIEERSFDPTEMLMEAVEIYRERSEEKQVELITHVHSNVPSRVIGDAGKLKQVLTNLLGICLRHARPGELMIDVSRDFSGRADHMSIEFSGSGLSHAGETLAALETLEPGTRHPDSAQLRLTIARQLVEAMGGQSGLRQGRGSPVIWLSLPARADDSITEEVNSSLLDGRHLLVVDDSSTMTRVIRQQAISWGMRVTACHTPREALASIRTQANLKDPYDIVIVDQDMPGMNGMQLAARIHDDPLPGKPPVIIMLTGMQNAPNRSAAREVGINRVIGKPVSGPWLRQALAEELGSATPARPTSVQPVPLQPNLRVLVAEDHQLSQKVILGMLGKLGVSADLVSSGEQVLDTLRQQHYDMVLMDCEMPGMDGFEATRQIRHWEQREGRDPIPVVALTAHILREHREKGRNAGMNAHIPKPVELDTLRDVIAQFTAFNPPAVAGNEPG